jgi:hypothetical protein
MHPYTRATQSLKTFLNDERVLNVVHYACESFYGKVGPTRVCAISVMHVGAGESKVFSIHKYVLDNGITDSKSLLADEALYKQAEQRLLEDFFKYAQEQGTAARWLNWNMNSESYGFAHLEQRYKQISGQSAWHIPEANRLDLDTVLGNIYGPFYMCDAKLLNLVKQNGLMKQNFRSGAEEAFAFLSADWKAIHESTHEKVGLIYAIAELALRYKLRTHIPTLWAHLSGWFSAQVEEHPIRFWTAIGITVIGLVASIIQIVSTRFH